MKTNGRKLPPAMTLHFFPVPPITQLRALSLYRYLVSFKHTLIKTKQHHQRKRVNIIRFVLKPMRTWTVLFFFFSWTDESNYVVFHQEALNTRSQPPISHFCPEFKKKLFFILLVVPLPCHKPTLAPATQTCGFQ